ncbi:hypothetical protein ASPZODRAFT_161917 [Penicilliopsis zonata CBS 506.65]|uniref:non-specific serine/threonine protein kinase n=1 Tax=Penicilliopsis zonata CBS 506.65 TaxID=1073090 RepID=A0A1L9S6Z3_9EURO|nr:hypothetical protein ASPZODRAFT_161917 [Penicilliopsis zonata CBS 506.65]OJJ42919.1 hypothetical protein ASPZODRAFT_161917 [Penicilliopsis zonata CBS 506.65]
MKTNDDFDMRVLYEPLGGIEKLENYRTGGYHPVQIGDHLHRRYRVVHKLGHGSYSTVWLAHDDQSNKYMTVKVCTANSNLKEVDIISALTHPRCPPVNHPGKMMIPAILDRFIIQGPNGTHACYVTAPARASLSGVKDGSWSRLFQLDVARIVHGDLHLGNILLQVPPDFDQLSVQQLYERYGAPGLDPVLRLDGSPLPRGVPSHGIAPIWLAEASEKITLSESRILLADFGEAFSHSKESKYKSYTPLVIRSPEAYFEPNTALSFLSDIWTLACTIWSIIAQRPLFEGFLMTQDDMTCEHVDALGVLPFEWWKSVQQPRRKRGIPSLDAREREAFFHMLRSMLAFRPGDRPTTKQILESEWMVKWALPEYQDNICP